MRIFSLRRLILITGLLTSLSACNLPTPSGITDPGSPTEIASLPAANTEQLCNNTMFPVSAGATWTYINSGGPAGPFSFTDTITDIRNDGFTISSQFSDLTRTQEWSCKPEGLLALTFGGGSAGSISAQGMTMDISTSNAAGVTLPADPQPGMEWDYSLDIDGTVNLAEGQSATASGTVTTPMKAVGMETVMIPAGTFEAMKIETTPRINLNATYQGISVPVTFTGTATLWFAPGVGWVKSEESGDFAGMSYSSITELQSYSLP